MHPLIRRDDFFLNTITTFVLSSLILLHEMPVLVITLLLRRASYYFKVQTQPFRDSAGWSKISLDNMSSVRALTGSLLPMGDLYIALVHLFIKCLAHAILRVCHWRRLQLYPYSRVSLTYKLNALQAHDTGLQGEDSCSTIPIRIR